MQDFKFILVRFTSNFSAELQFFLVLLSRRQSDRARLFQPAYTPLQLSSYPKAEYDFINSSQLYKADKTKDRKINLILETIELQKFRLNASEVLVKQFVSSLRSFYLNLSEASGLLNLSPSF